MNIRLIRLIAQQTHLLRHAVLRPNQPLDACEYPDDDHPDSGHFGVFSGDRLVAVASVYHQDRDDGKDPGAWRIRGMAAHADVRGKGYGRMLVEACVEHVRRNGGTHIWCNARTTVSGFYQHMGFEVEGDEFELPGIGPHHVMFFNL